MIYFFLSFFLNLASVRDERAQNIKTFSETQCKNLNIYQIKCKLRQSHMLTMSESFQVLVQVNIQSHLY